MQRVRLEDVPWLEWFSPSRRFHGQGRQISEALGARHNAPIGAGGHPFDLEQGRLQPGKSGCPFHSHSAQWEMFLLLSGTATVRFADQQRALQAGQAVLHPPGEPHELINSGKEELTYFLIADNPLTEVWHYPDSNKWGFRPGGRYFKDEPVDYWLGEDEAAPPARRPQQGGQASDFGFGPRSAEPAGPSGGERSPLARFVTLEDLAWEERRSPSGRFRSYCRDVSLALGGRRNVGVAHGGHPFDVQIRRVPPGAAICPFHLHIAQWELFVVLRGRGTVRSGERQETIAAGDVTLHPPGIPHQTRAAADEELECLILADNPLVDAFYYPESNKWGLRPPDKFFRMTEVTYFDGEDPDALAAP